jgi:hypothetical protein
MVRARVSDLQDIPHFIVLTDAEGFQGESWTVQCEIIEQQVLGAVAADEEVIPVHDAHENPRMFDFFGLGQPGASPFAQQVLPSQFGAQNAQLGNPQDEQLDEVPEVQGQENFVGQELMEIVPVPQHVFEFDLNNAPGDLNELDPMIDLNLQNPMAEVGLQQDNAMQQEEPMDGLQQDEFEEIGNGLLNLNDEPHDANEMLGSENPSSMSIGSTAGIGVSSADSTSLQNQEEAEVPETVLALQAQPINFMHLEIQSHELNVVNSQGEVSEDSNESVQGPILMDPLPAIIPIQVEGGSQRYNSSLHLDDNLNVSLSLLPKSIDVDPGLEAHLLSKRCLIGQLIRRLIESDYGQSTLLVPGSWGASRCHKIGVISSL